MNALQVINMLKVMYTAKTSNKELKDKPCKAATSLGF